MAAGSSPGERRHLLAAAGRRAPELAGLRSALESAPAPGGARGGHRPDEARLGGSRPTRRSPAPKNEPGMATGADAWARAPAHPRNVDRLPRPGQLPPGGARRGPASGSHPAGRRLAGGATVPPDREVTSVVTARRARHPDGTEGRRRADDAERARSSPRKAVQTPSCSAKRDQPRSRRAVISAPTPACRWRVASRTRCACGGERARPRGRGPAPEGPRPRRRAWDRPAGRPPRRRRATLADKAEHPTATPTGCRGPPTPRAGCGPCGGDRS